MRKTILALCFLLFLLSPNLALADCADLSRSTDWVLEGKHTIVFYMGDIPLARVNIPYCEILPTSTIRLDTFYVCDSDDIFIDNKPCSVMTVEVLY